MKKSLVNPDLINKKWIETTDIGGVEGETVRRPHRQLPDQWTVQDILAEEEGSPQGGGGSRDTVHVAVLVEDFLKVIYDFLILLFT